MTARRTLIALALAMVAGTSCGGGGEEADDTSPGAGGGGGGGTVTLTAADFAFQPSELSAGVGDTIEFSNEDDTTHNFTAEEAALDEDVDAGDTVTIDLADVEAGTYDFVCSFHPDTMTGTLEVAE